MDKIDDKIVLELLHHPMVRHILHMARWHESYWKESRSREDNILMGLRYIMVTGRQSELYKYMEEKHVLKTEDGLVDFNRIAKDGSIGGLVPLLEFIARKNLVHELEYSNTFARKYAARMLIYVNQHGNMDYQFLDAGGLSSNYTVTYKKLLGIILSDYNSNFYGEYGRNTELITSKERVASLIARGVTGKLIYVGD